MSKATERFAEWLIRARWWLLACAVVLAVMTTLRSDSAIVATVFGPRVAAWFPAGQLEFDRSIENMFAADDPLVPPYRRLKERFGGNEIILAAYEDPELFSPDGRGISRLASIAVRLSTAPGVEEVLSLSNLSDAIGASRNLLTLIGAKQKPDPRAIVDPDDRLAEGFRNLFEGYTHSTRDSTAAIVCMLVPERETPVPRRETVQAIRAIMNDLPDGLQAGTIAGEPVMVVDGFQYVEQDGTRLGWATTVLLAFTIVLCFRSLRWVLIPIAVVKLTDWLTRAVLVWSGAKLSMVSSMLTAIVTVVGVATVVHVIVRFREARQAGLEARPALARTIALLAVPVFWACTTDAVGFLSLMWAQVGPVRDFGMMMAIGSSLVLAAVVLVVPGMALWGRLDPDPHNAPGERHLGSFLGRLIVWVHRRPRRVGILAGIAVVASVSGVSRLEVETDFTRNFRTASPIVQSYRFVEQRLGGAGVWDVVVTAPCSYDREFFAEVRELEQEMRSIEVAGEPAVTKVISLVDALDATESDRRLRLVAARFRLAQMERQMPTFMRALRTTTPDADGQCYFRIMLRAPERQPAARKLELIDRVTTQVRTHFPGEGEAEVTGFFVLLANLIRSMIRDQWLCFAVATVGIAIMMILAFRSPVLAVVALIPNALPILMVLGLMGWCGLRMNMGAAMIAAVSMGLSIDSSIHYIISFQRARHGGKSVHQALDDVQQTAGRALVFSTAALIVGFTVLSSSSFIPTIYFGALVSLSMLGGLFGNLLVLPLLLRAVSTGD